MGLNIKSSHWFYVLITFFVIAQTNLIFHLTSFWEEGLLSNMLIYKVIRLISSVPKDLPYAFQSLWPYYIYLQRNSQVHSFKHFCSVIHMISLGTIILWTCWVKSHDHRLQANLNIEHGLP